MQCYYKTAAEQPAIRARSLQQKGVIYSDYFMCVAASVRAVLPAFVLQACLGLATK